MQLTAVYIPVPEGYIAFVEELPGANTQGATLEEVRENLKEAVHLVEMIVQHAVAHDRS
jgi:predicted RNase H-like HicB family nuclease